MTADTPPATPTPAALAAALTMLDAATETLGARSFYVVQGDAWLTAVFTVARASLAYDVEDLLADELPLDADTDALDALLAPIVTRRDAALDAYNAAVARLVALATGAQAGEGAGGS